MRVFPNIATGAKRKREERCPLVGTPSVGKHSQSLEIALYCFFLRHLRDAKGCIHARVVRKDVLPFGGGGLDGRTEGQIDLILNGRVLHIRGGKKRLNAAKPINLHDDAGTGEKHAMPFLTADRPASGDIALHHNGCPIFGMGDMGADVMRANVSGGRHCPIAFGMTSDMYHAPANDALMASDLMRPYHPLSMGGKNCGPDRFGEF